MSRTTRMTLKINELRARLAKLEKSPARDSERPILEVGMDALKQEIDSLGRTLEDRARRRL